MGNIYRDTIFEIEEIKVQPDEELFERILNERKNEIDSERFFLKYISPSDLEKYDFSDKKSVNEFREKSFTFISPIKPMGGCNLYLKEDIRYNGIKVSDPYGQIEGVFDIRNKIVTYSPIFPHLYIERDIIKFADDSYFTSISFEEIMRRIINKQEKFVLHTGNYKTSSDISKRGQYILEDVTKEDMIRFTKDKGEGAKVLSKYLGTSIKHGRD